MNKKLIITYILSFLCLATISAQSYHIEGEWYNEEKDAIITIYKTTKNKYEGKITWMKFPNDENGNPKTDALNDDETKRSRSRMGMVIMYDFKYKGKGKWEDGEVYDPKSGNTYSGTISMVSNDKLDLRGYIGISWFGRTSHWTRRTK